MPGPTCLYAERHPVRGLLAGRVSDSEQEGVLSLAQVQELEQGCPGTLAQSRGPSEHSDIGQKGTCQEYPTTRLLNGLQSCFINCCFPKKELNLKGSSSAESYIHKPDKQVLPPRYKV